MYSVCIYTYTLSYLSSLPAWIKTICILIIIIIYFS